MVLDLLSSLLWLETELVDESEGVCLLPPVGERLTLGIQGLVDLQDLLRLCIKGLNRVEHVSLDRPLLILRLFCDIVI